MLREKEDLASKLDLNSSSGSTHHHDHHHHHAGPPMAASTAEQKYLVSHTHSHRSFAPHSLPVCLPG